MRFSLGLGLLAFATFPYIAQGQQLTARDAFWSASDLVSVSPNAAAKTPPAARHTPKPASPKPQPRSSTHLDEPAPHVDPQLVAENGYGAQPHLMRVSREQIGLRYSLLLREADGRYSEVSPTKVFHSGDQLHISVMANQPGYLYVVAQGSSGNWSPIFPGPGSAPDANRVAQGKLYEFPNGKLTFRFDKQPGEEKLFLIVSRQPIADLDSTIERLKSPTAAPRPEAPTGAGAVYEASNQIPNEVLRSFASRDLQLVQEQQVDDSAKQDDAGEKAVYVVAKGLSAGSQSPQVVASVTMRHE